jgi:hypothetical protein
MQDVLWKRAPLRAPSGTLPRQCPVLISGRGQGPVLDMGLCHFA